MCRQLILANPSFVASVSRDDVTKVFDGMCIALQPFIDGFIHGCRPVIGLNGCFLKGKYGGVLLTTTALDGNNSLYPLAIYICE
ncbi:hypothetical protein BVC80_533g3 [Macleaya cordata]|uniref:Uncharacterized protein n=1 Tax=Macleaya cordata TaxID=56857 RepID=A0A200PMR8_MACCD|nr:hypothetical protein BVC80_533g3 [Macleaya cordata]